MKIKTVLKSRNNGMALPLALVSVLLLLIMGFSLLELGVKNRLFVIRDTSDISARCAADSGLTKAIFEIKQKMLGNSWFGSEMPSETNIQLANCNAIFEYTTTLQPDGSYLVESTGTNGINQRTVRCVLQKKSPFKSAIFADGSITIKNSGKVGWYNGEPGSNFMVGTNSIENNTVTLYNSSIIEGGVIVGAGGIPDDVVDLKSGAEIEGDITSLSQENELIIPEVPEWLQSLPLNDTIKNNITISESAKYNGIDLNSGKKITVTDDVSLYITGNLTLGNSSQIQIMDGASLTLYLDGNLIGKNSCAINNETEIPKNLQIYGLEGCTEFDLRNGSDSYGIFYAPNANFILHNSVTIYGAIVCDTFEIKNSGQIMYDASLEDETFTPVPTDFTVTNWNESIGK